MPSTKPPQNKKRVISAKSLANLRPNPQHLKYRGGSKRREYVTNQELEVLNNLLDGSNHRDAARRAGLSEGINVTDLLKRPIIDHTFKELQEKRATQSVEAAERRREERSQFGHGELIHRLRTAQTHEKTGDLGIAKMFEVLFRSTGDIPSARFSATATAGAQANAPTIVEHLFTPEWQQATPPSTIEPEVLPNAKLEASKPRTVSRACSRTR